jgi:hypothetical protein
MLWPRPSAGKDIAPFLRLTIYRERKTDSTFYIRDSSTSSWQASATPVRNNWKHGIQTNISISLIADTDLLAEYGELLGKICESHLWPIERLPQELPAHISPNARFREWTVTEAV